MPFHSLSPVSQTCVLGLWHLTEAAEELWPLLPAQTHYLSRYPAGRDELRARQWLAGRVLAHYLLRELNDTPATLHNDPNGRPYFPELPAAGVSLSHSGEWVAGLLSTQAAVGIDIEQVRPKAQQLARRFLSEAEQANAGNETAKYCLYWSAKETLYKLHSRRGLVFKEQLLLSPFELREAGVLTGHLLLENFRSQHHIRYLRPTPDYVLTYAIGEVVNW
ncbi:4'-phosphopantetheinyl transferase EntD [Hymenobacter luteus]|uniref:Enterobactin synthase component D n=2 Tax=Hymenobacter TaxID=89966 RepID=A0A7W9SX00_9BACT|nr:MULTISPECIES: 4'-phosphopantetheinyl transferase superfamily protein [Hymenobacter]MBB4600275.1 4'-phosphopantetheinyl transferase EntD [Hymenobacter latericoloratus]MBB6057415.1 4'-phosphopantetheinyl transferase EntD [Hymenobacter luteus]